MADIGVFVGVDVSKGWLDLAVRPEAEGSHARYPNDEQGIDSVVGWVREVDPALVVLEASGGYERAVFSALSEGGVPAAVVNPRQVRDFAKATGQLAKTDRLDARALAHFGEAIKPAPTPCPSQEASDLRALRTRRMQLIKMHVAESTRLDTAAPLVKPAIQQHVDWLEQEIKTTEWALQAAIERSPEWSQKAKILRSAPGIGSATASLLLSQLPELGELSHKQVTALVGLAPMACDSGTLRGKRMIRGGRAAVRRGLYMPTISAINCNPVIRAFYQRLVAAKKPGMVAIVACMRKLLIICNAMIRSGSPWRAKAHSATKGPDDIAGGFHPQAQPVAPLTTTFALDDDMESEVVLSFT